MGTKSKDQVGHRGQSSEAKKNVAHRSSFVGETGKEIEWKGRLEQSKEKKRGTRPKERAHIIISFYFNKINKYFNKKQNKFIDTFRLD
jgi:hypothetical protein